MERLVVVHFFPAANHLNSRGAKSSFMARVINMHLRLLIVSYDLWAYSGVGKHVGNFLAVLIQIAAIILHYVWISNEDCDKKKQTGKILQSLRNKIG